MKAHLAPPLLDRRVAPLALLTAHAHAIVAPSATLPRVLALGAAGRAGALWLLTTHGVALGLGHLALVKSYHVALPAILASSFLVAVAREVAANHSLKEAYDTVVPALESKYGHWSIFAHCMPFDISRAYDEASGMDHPRIWTADRDKEMWQQLEQ